MPNSLVIDLSHHNTIPESLIPARDSGVRGIIHKATEGTGFVDSKLAARFELALKAGMLWGTYHFIRPGEITEQANFFCDAVVPYLDLNSLVALDYEDAGVTLGDCRDWIEIVEKRLERAVVLYSGHVLKDKLKAGHSPGWLTERRLWLADYTSPPDLPNGWARYWLWQWSDSASVPGITPPTDVNDFQDGIDELEESWSGVPDDVEPEPVIRPIVTIITDGDVQFLINGKLVE